MEQEVYIDLLFLINFSMDYLCLYICGKVLRKKLKLIRLISAAATGGAYSVISLFFPFSPTVNLIIDALFCLVICAIAFAEKGRRISSTLVCGFLFVGISMMTGGAMTAIFNFLNKLDLPLDSIEGDGISTYLFAIIAAVAGIITLRSGEIISKRSDIKECNITLTFGGKTAQFFALSDSGNLVKDPLSGKNVVLIDRDALSTLTDITVFDKFLGGHQVSTYSGMKGLRIVPIKTASGRSFLPAVIPERLSAEIVTKSGKTLSLDLDALIAPSDIGKSAAGYKAIVPAQILKF